MTGGLWLRYAEHMATGFEFYELEALPGRDKYETGITSLGNIDWTSADGLNQPPISAQTVDRCRVLLSWWLCRSWQMLSPDTCASLCA